MIIAVLTGIQSYSQEKFTVSGTVRVKKTGETVIGASIRAGDAGTFSNDYGFYSISLPAGNYTIAVSHSGHAYLFAEHYT